MKTKSYIKYIPVFLSLAIFFGFAVGFLILPKRDFSDNENRVLAKCPELSVKSVADGSFQKDFENFLSDQFPLRDRLLSLSVLAARTEGKNEINHVLYLKDESGKIRLLDCYEKPQNAEKFVNAVTKFADKTENANVIVMLVPTAISLYEEDLPKIYKAQNYPNQKDTLKYFGNAFSGSVQAEADTNLDLDQEAAEKTEPFTISDNEETTEIISENRKIAGEKIRYVTELPELMAAEKEKGENLYYRTDHHWTMQGAYLGFTALAPYLNIPITEKPEFQTVSDNFRGTTWSKVCDGTVSPDCIEIYENPDWQNSLTVIYEDTKETSNSPYNREYLNQKDQYSMFLNNQNSLIWIENRNADLSGPVFDSVSTSDSAMDSGSDSASDFSGGRSLVVIKDSYANSLIPFLIDYYETIWVIDPRYYKGSISSWVNEHPEVEDVLILYNLGTMDNDRGIGAIY